MNWTCVLAGSVCGSNSSLGVFMSLDTDIYPKILTRPLKFKKPDQNFTVCPGGLAVVQAFQMKPKAGKDLNLSRVLLSPGKDW